MKLICDQMLGTLATWLRILGFDTAYLQHDLTDDALVSYAQKEQRFIITRDKLLFQKAQKQKKPALLLHTKNLDEQLYTVLETIPHDPVRILTRCILCNSLLQQIDKSILSGKIPDAVFKKHENFLACPTCSKIYWKGTHYDNMMKKIEMIGKNK